LVPADKSSAGNLAVAPHLDSKAGRQIANKATPEREKLLDEVQRISTAGKNQAPARGMVVESSPNRESPRQSHRAQKNLEVHKPSEIKTSTIATYTENRDINTGTGIPEKRCYNCNEQEVEERPPHGTLHCLWGCGHCGAKKGKDGEGGHATYMCPENFKLDKKYDLMHKDRRARLERFEAEKKEKKTIDNPSRIKVGRNRKMGSDKGTVAWYVTLMRIGLQDLNASLCVVY
jgi:hypothetical protein